jgi:hypothetical protein
MFSPTLCQLYLVNVACSLRTGSFSANPAPQFRLHVGGRQGMPVDAVAWIPLVPVFWRPPHRYTLPDRIHHGPDLTAGDAGAASACPADAPLDLYPQQYRETTFTTSAVLNV